MCCVVEKPRLDTPHSHSGTLWFALGVALGPRGVSSACVVVLSACVYRGGGVTTLDALSAGTPVVTLPTEQTVVQLAAGMYRHIGLEDFIVQVCVRSCVCVCVSRMCMLVDGHM